MGNICIIPARGGSKRIPRKNIKSFLGKPIIAYSIEAAISSKLFDEVMVSTDDDEISKVAQNYGAKVPFKRSEKNSDDFSNTVDVLLEVIEDYNKLGKNFENVCCIYPTAPFISIVKLLEGYRLLKNDQRGVVMPIIAFSYPIWRGFEKLHNEKIEMIMPEYLNSRSQDLKEVYHDAGQWYWINTKELKEEKKLYTNNTSGVVLDEMEIQDIDNISDWKIAEFKYEYLQSLK